MPEQYRLMVHLAAWCALRYGEIAALRRRDVDVQAGVVHVVHGVTWVAGTPQEGDPKSDAGKRDVAIPPHLIPIVRAHLERHTAWGRDGLLFPNAAGTWLAPTSFYAHWWPAEKRPGGLICDSTTCGIPGRRWPLRKAPRSPS